MQKTDFFFILELNSGGRMSEFILEISENGKYINASRGFVVISENNKELGKVPIDTILAAIISADGAVVCKSFFTRLGEENIPIIICGKNYAPLSIATPVSAHYKSLEVAQTQLACPGTLQKQLWKKIIQAKILNQVEVLKYFCPSSLKVQDKMILLKQKVRAGDTDNNEAHAARLYWPTLFGTNFIRDTDQEGINSFLNYSYAIIRSAVIRALCASGLLPMFGIFHHNKLNAFCLADDLMEPLRPFADAMVFSLIKAGHTELEPAVKRQLSKILIYGIKNGNKLTTLVPMAFNMAQTLSKSYTLQQDMLHLPELVLPFKE